MEKIAETMTFEEALARLESQVKLLENGKLPLEETLKVFEQSVALSRFCTGKLDMAQKKVEKIVEENGDYSLETFEE